MWEYIMFKDTSRMVMVIITSIPFDSYLNGAFQIVCDRRGALEYDQYCISDPPLSYP
jgi:hypothetical protein